MGGLDFILLIRSVLRSIDKANIVSILTALNIMFMMQYYIGRLTFRVKTTSSDPMEKSESAIVQ